MDYETLTETEWDVVGRIWDLLEEGRLETARIEIDALLKARPGHPDLRIVNAAISLDEGEPARALQALRGAERSADPALFFHLRAMAQFELARFEQARDDALNAIAVQPELAEAHDLLSRTYEHLGEISLALEHEAEARSIDPEEFTPPLDVSDSEFDALVQASLEELPAKVRKHLDEVTVVVEPLPSRDVLSAEEDPLSPDLLGLFVGGHLLERSHSDAPSMPATIYLFRRNLLRACADREELRREVRITVQHEVGHMLGLEEDDLEQWGLA